MAVIIHDVPASLPAEAELWRAIPVAVAVDLGRDTGQIDPAIRPLRPAGTQPPLFGPAVTVRCEPPDFGAMLHVLDVVRPGDVVVIAAGGHAETAMIGDILGSHLRRRGAAGLVCDGAVRDTATLGSWTDFPVFTRWVTPRGPSSAERGEVNGTVVVGGRLVNPGDLVIGDDDGLVVLAPPVIAGRLAEAQARLAKEEGWRRALESGRPARDVFGLGAPGGAEQP